MAKLGPNERTELERILQMGGGYVLDFTNPTFGDFVADSTGRNISHPAYDRGSGSKANRLRAFWDHEPPHIVGKLINDLLDRVADMGPPLPLEYKDCRAIATRLLSEKSISDLDAISPNADARDFHLLAKAVRDSI